MRITIKIERDEDPLVFDLLDAIQKGPSRANRAKTLLHDGALLQAYSWQAPIDAARHPAPSLDARALGAAGIFDDAMAE